MRSRSNATNLLLRWLGATVLMALAVCAAQAREMTMRVRLSVSANSTRLKVEGFYRQGSKSWRFVNSSGRLLGLGSRIQNLRLLSEGKDLFIRKLAPGEFASDENAAEFNYEVDLTPPQARDDAAHISWLDGQQGYLMLGDLLPDSAAGPIEVELELPPHWLAQSSSKSKTQWKYELDEKANAIFFVGAALKEKQEKVGSTEITFVASGEWAFSRDAAVGRAARIVKEFQGRTGFPLNRPVTVMLSAFPSNDVQGWSAETRGANVVLLVNRNGSRFSLGQLSVALCHELFHLWVPNSLHFKGDFDWFFEGFTLYEALCVAVKLRFIDFQEYLDSLSRVYASYRSKSDGDLSLIEASQRRWTSGSSQVYDQGMLVGFIVDLKLRKESTNQLSIDSVYRRLFQLYGESAADVDGNDALISLLAESLKDAEFVRANIQKPAHIDLATALPAYGFRLIADQGQQRITVTGALNSEQGLLLNSLGYRKR